MKKTFSKIIALFLCAVTAFGVSPAVFSANGTASGTGSEVELPLSYDEEQDYYYISEDEIDFNGLTWSEYCESHAPVNAMFYDELRIGFEYENKNWIFNLRKGQYGWIFIGSEISVLTSSDKNASIEDYVFAEAADRPEMEIVLFHDPELEEHYGEKFTTEYAPCAMANGYTKGQLTDYQVPKKEISTVNRITFESAEMAGLFIKGLADKGFAKAYSTEHLTPGFDKYYQNGEDVYFVWTGLYFDHFLELDCEDAVIAKGETLQLNVCFAPVAENAPALIWESSDPSVADVDGNGKVTAKNYGTAIIKVRSEIGRNTECRVEVKDNSPGYYIHTLFSIISNVLRDIYNLISRFV